MTKSENQYSIIKYVILLFVLMLTPAIAVKLTQYFKSESKNTTGVSIEKSQIDESVKNYIKNNSEELLNAVMTAYYSKSSRIKKDERINNAILFFEKILFDDRLPKILSDKKKVSNIAVIFSDFDTVLPMLEEINSTPEKLKVNFFFRQLMTQSRISGIIARYGYAIYKIEPKLYLPFYISLLKISRKDLDEKSVEAILKKFEMNLEDVKKIADASESEQIVLSTNELVNQLNVDQLPAFIFENGRIVFGQYGFESVKRMMYENE